MSSDLTSNYFSSLGQTKHEPVIPIDAEPRISTSLYKEIIEDVPTKVSLFPRNLREGLYTCPS